MNTKHLELMSTMLGEVVAGTWKGRKPEAKSFCGIEFGGVPIKSFDLCSWTSTKNCGYSACAVGHACYDKRFNKLGLYTDYTGVPLLMKIDGKMVSSWNAVTEFFDISTRVGELLFRIDTYDVDNPTALDVKARVDQLLMLGEHEFCYPTQPKNITQV